MKRLIKSSYFAIILAFIYVPIIVMIIFSFNSGESVFNWSGFDTKWYDAFVHNSPFLKSIITSLFVAVVSTAISLVIGVMAAIGLSRVRKVTQRKWFGIANIPLINADVVTAVSLMIIFLLTGTQFGIFTLIMAHVSFNVPYVLITVMPRLRKIDPAIVSAAQDLGAKPHQIIFKVILPILKPAIITAAAIAFAMSFDDFIISYFTGGDQTNFSTFIYTAKKVQPYIFAFGTILVGTIVLAIIIWNAVAIYKQQKLETIKKIKNGSYKSKELYKLNKELEQLKYDLQTYSYVKKTWQISLWFKLLLLNLKIWFVGLKNYNKKITKLEWKAAKLRNEINKEKRYEARLAKAIKKKKSLEKQIEKTLDIKKAAKASIQLEKINTTIEFLQEEIEIIKDRENLAKKKAIKIQKQINDLNKEIKNGDLSKKLIKKTHKKIKELEEWKIEVLEGKKVYKLKLLLEEGKELREINLNHIVDLTHKKEELELKIYARVSLFSSIENELAKDNLTSERKRELFNQREEQLLKYETNYLNIIKLKNNKLTKLEDKVIRAKAKLQPDADSEEYHVKGFFARSWKIIIISVLGISAFSGLTTAYVMNNVYDLVIANWGAYIDPALISQFEEEYGVKVNYQEYDSNETLYNKLYTFSYDVMVPSDYMVQKLVEEDRLLELNYNKLIIDTANIITPGATTKNNEEKNKLADSLVSVMKKSTVHPKENVEKDHEEDGIYPSTGSILDYAVPYFWGDLVVVVNPTQSNIDFLNKRGLTIEDNGKITPIEGTDAKLSWNIFWDAAKDGKEVALNSDPKNIFMLAQATSTEGGVNLTTPSQVDAAVPRIEQLIKPNNVSLNGDDLITKVAEGLFDFALMYNGDAAYANMVYNHEDDDDNTNDGNTKFIYGRPAEEKTNVFSDNMVIAKKNRNVELSYAFVNFITTHSVEISEYVGNVSPIQSAIDELTTNEGTYANYADLYDLSKNKTGEAFTYNHEVDDYLVDKYNSIIAGKN